MRQVRRSCDMSTSIRWATSHGATFESHSRGSCVFAMAAYAFRADRRDSATQRRGGPEQESGETRATSGSCQPKSTGFRESLMDRLVPERVAATRRDRGVFWARIPAGDALPDDGTMKSSPRVSISEYRGVDHREQRPGYAALCRDGLGFEVTFERERRIEGRHRDR
jgi:hypothetical protein